MDQNLTNGLDKKLPSDSEKEGEIREPFFVFDRPYIEYENLEANELVDPTNSNRNTVILQRNLDEFCTVKVDPSFIPNRENARRIPSCCKLCLPNAIKHITEFNKNKNLINSLLIKDEPTASWYVRRFSYIAYFWKRSYIVNQYNYVTSKEIIDDSKLKSFMKEMEFDSKHPNQLKKIKIQIENFIKSVYVSPFSRLRFLVSTWALRIFLRSMFGAIFVHLGQIGQIKLAQEKGLPLVFIPINKSVLDPLILSWTLNHNNLQSPFFFCTQNVKRDQFLRKLMRLTGVSLMFKNESDNSSTKKSVTSFVVSNYLSLILKKNNNVLISLESNRSRNGLPSTCLFGSEVLEVLVNLFESKQLEDAYIIPVSTSFEKVPEEYEYLKLLSEQLSGNNDGKHQISYFKLFYNFLRKPASNVRIDFGQPFSLREFKVAVDSSMKWAEASSGGNGHCITVSGNDLCYDQEVASVSSLPSLYGDLKPDLSPMTFIDLLANHTIYDAFMCTTIMSTHVLAFFLVKKYRNGASLEQLIVDFDQFPSIAKEKGVDLGYRGETKEVILRAAKILGSHLITVTYPNSSPFFKAVSDSAGLVQLCYYANHVAPLYIEQALLSSAIFALLGKEMTIPTFVNETTISFPARNFSHAYVQAYKLLKTQFFIHPPCIPVDEAIKRSLEEFQKTGILRWEEKKQIRDQDDADWESDHETETRSHEIDGDIYLYLNREIMEDLIFWRNLVMGYFEVYRVAYIFLFSLVRPEINSGEIEERVMHKQMLDLCRKYCRQDICGDVLSHSTVKVFVNMMLELEVLCYFFNEEYKKRHYYLTDNFSTTEQLEQLYETIDRHIFY